MIDRGGARPRPLLGHRGDVNAIAFSSDGRYVVTVSDDATVRMWEARRGQALWWAPLLLAEQQAWLLTQAGWQAVGEGRGRPPSGHWTVAARAADRADLEPDGATLCLQRADEIELWNRRKDRRLLKRRMSPARRLIAIDRGCVIMTLAGGVARIDARGVARTLLDAGATALGRDGRRLLVAAGTEALVFEPGGAVPNERLPIDEGVTAIALDHDRLLIGHRDGNVDVIGRGAALPRETLSLEDVPSSPVLRMATLPQKTLALGFGDGSVGLWDIRTGTRLEHERLHGAVTHLVVGHGRLLAASELGRHTAWNVDVLYDDYCTLIARVWREVPVVWRETGATASPLPSRHACRRNTRGEATVPARAPQ